MKEKIYPPDAASENGLEIAVIGMAGRFPGARNLHEFWNNLKNGVETVTFFSREEMERAGVSSRLLDNPNFVGARGYLQDADCFDAAFFGYTPAEARLMDPQLRVYHECVWSALEDAGCDPSRSSSLIGVYTGAHPNVSWISGILGGLDNSSQRFEATNMNSSSAFGTRISFSLNLKGPSFTVQTACSTSLVSIHLGCQGLLNAECDIAVAGGVSIASNAKLGYVYMEGMINSPDGHCRPFDARSAGTLSANGAGAVVLKRLEDAMEDGDHIYAVVKGSAINNDGNRKIGFSAPSVDGQADVIKSALETAEIEPETITYIETHGTGTALGDPIEIEGLKLAFDTDKKGFCAIGAAKSFFGHCDNAAGVAGFIKTVLSIHHREIPPCLHFESPNPAIDFADSPFYVNTKSTPWNPGNLPLRAGVSSFGIGGTNAHAILEETPREYREAESGPSRLEHLIVLSARTRDALKRNVENLAAYWRENPGISLSDAAYTLKTGRKRFKYRAYTVCNSIPEALGNLNAEAMETGQLPVSASVEEDPPIVFMFSGQGAQYVDMGRELYQAEPVFREVMDDCFRFLEPLTGYDLRPVLYPEPGKTASGDVNQTEATQPLIFSFEYALAKLLASWGIEPAAMIGHSIGEYAAACLAGVFSLEDALTLVSLRGKLMQGMPSGAMVSVSLPAAELEDILPGNLSMAAVNGPNNCVVSGDRADIASFIRFLDEKGYNNRSLHTSHAFHSHMMDPILSQFREGAEAININPPAMPYVSNVTGTWITEADIADPGYWTSHLRGTVRFYDGLTALLEKHGDAVLLEVGPGSALSTLSRQHPQKNPRQAVINLVRHPREETPDHRFLLGRLGQLWQKGAAIDWSGFYAGEERRRVSLPAYSFEPQVFTPPFGKTVKVVSADSVGAPAKPVKHSDISRWFYVPGWKGVPMPVNPFPAFTPGMSWLVFMDNCGLGERLIEKLRSAGQDIVTVARGSEFSGGDGHGDLFTIEPGTEDHYDKLWSALKKRGTVPGRLLHLWGVTGGNRDLTPDDEQSVEEQLRSGFYSLLYIVRASGRIGITSPYTLAAITDFMVDAVGGETVYPAKSAILGPLGIIPKEYSNIKCRSIDISREDSEKDESVVACLLAELTREDNEPMVALRPGRRWLPEMEQVPLRPAEQAGALACKLKKHGVYIITGGLGGIGRTLAGELARKWQARLVLIDRAQFPEHNLWQEYLDNHSALDKTYRVIAQLKQFEKDGAAVLVCKADIVDDVQMDAAISRARERFGSIDGVIHAAGLPDGSVIQAREQQSFERILEPKIKGTFILDRLLQPDSPDFFCVFSSLSVFIPPVGQVGYCAANRFLDAFAQYRTASGRGYTVAINWDTWLEIGMAVDAGREDVKIKPVNHPLLSGTAELSAKHRVYQGIFEADRSWVLDQHRIQGKATLPGTGYIELLRAAFEDLSGSGTCEIRELSFLVPLTVDDNAQLPVLIDMRENSDYYDFTVKSRVNDRWREHARGRIAGLPVNETGVLTRNIGQLTDRCDQSVIQNPGVKGQTGGDSKFLEVGPRWNNIKTLRYGMNEGLAEIQIPEAYEQDLVSYPLHPALMDTATSFLLGKFRNDKPFLPFVIKRIRIYGSLPRHFYSHSVRVEEKIPAIPGRETLRFNVTVLEPTGSVRIQFEEFTLVHAASGEKQTGRPTSAAANNASPVRPGGIGILSAEGVDVFNRVMCGSLPQVIISTADFHQRVRFIQSQSVSAQGGTETGSREEENENENFGHPRPELSTPYIAPVSGTQKKLAKIWGRLLGIGQIGIKDDFFELGGDSLKGLTVVAEARKQLNVELSITEMFTYPTIEALAENLGNAGEAEDKYAAIEPVEEKEYYPLSSAQSRLYFLQQIHKDSIFYNISQAKILEGELTPQMLESAFERIIQRHESLRTTYRLLDGEPVQVIEKDVSFKIEYSDAHVGGTVSREELRERVRAFIRPFDLSKAPLIRNALVKIAIDRHLWIFDIHHISSDATGFTIIQNEVFKLLNNEELPSLRMRYRDFSCWQNHLIRTGGIKKQEDYWLGMYPESPGVPRLNLPTDFPRPENTRYQGEMYFFFLGESETARLKEICSRTGTTVFFNLMTVLYILLYKYSGQEDIVVGSSINGRPHADLTRIVGMFVNMLAIRSRVDPSASFTGQLERVKTRCLEAFENQDMQFELLVDKLNLDLSSSRNPLFDVCLNVQNYAEPDFNTLKAIKTHSFGTEYHNAKFDLLLWAADLGDKIRFSLEYSTELFKRSTAQDFAGHIIEIIEQITANPEIPVDGIRLTHKVVQPKAEVPDIEFGF